MLIEKQCCNIDYSERLKELGVNQKSLYYHTYSKYGILPKQSIDFKGNPTSAFTCAELVQLNEDIGDIHFSHKNRKFFSGSGISNTLVYYETFSDALAARLLDFIKNEWVTVDELNARMLP